MNTTGSDRLAWKPNTKPHNPAHRSAAASRPSAFGKGLPLVLWASPRLDEKGRHGRKAGAERRSCFEHNRARQDVFFSSACANHHFMKTVLTLLICAFWATCHGQAKPERKKVARFKNDLLANREMYVPDTLHTATAMLIRERYPNVRGITIYPKAEKLKHVEYYYNDTRILEHTISYKLPSGMLTGVSKHYDKKGRLEYVQDHDQGTWTVTRADNFPYYGQLKKIKEGVDSLIVSNYGLDFFNKHIIWSPEGSAFYNGKGAGATWYDYEEWAPKEFLLRYSIRLSEEEIYDDQLEVHLDSLGKVFFPFNQLEDIKGFEKIEKKEGFVLTKNKAIDQSKDHGLVESDTAKAFTFLTWEYHDEMEGVIHNGHFTYNVAINTKTITHQPTNGRNRIEYKFDVYSFSPWTGAFMGKQKKKAYREWGKVSGMTTGLLPDN